MLADLDKKSLCAIWPVVTVLDSGNGGGLEIESPRLCKFRDLDDKIWNRRLVVVFIDNLELRGDHKAVGSREQGCKDSGPRPIPHALLRWLMSGVVFQYLARKGRKGHVN